MGMVWRHCTSLDSIFGWKFPNNNFPILEVYRVFFATYYGFRCSKLFINTPNRSFQIGKQNMQILKKNTPYTYLSQAVQNLYLTASKHCKLLFFVMLRGGERYHQTVFSGVTSKHFTITLLSRNFR